MTTPTDSGGAIVPALIAGAPSAILRGLTPVPRPPRHSAPSETRSSRPPSRNGYFDVAATRRSRAVQRRRVLEAARLGMTIIAGVALINCAMLIAIHPDAAGILLMTNGALFGVACAGHLVLAQRGRRAASWVAFVASGAVTAASIVLALVEPELTLLATGYLLLTPVAVAMIVPWRTAIHALWLSLVSVGALVFTLGAPDSVLQLPQRLDLVVLIIVAAAVSQAGHVRSLRVQVVAHMQLGRINHLRGSPSATACDSSRMCRPYAVGSIETTSATPFSWWISIGSRR